VVFVVGLGVLGTANLGSAASLAVSTSAVSTATVSHPCPGTLAATTPSTSLPVSTVMVTAPAACAGRQLQVAVTSGGATVQGTATAPASGAVVVTLSGAYTPSTTTVVAATVSGWDLPATWTYTPVTNSCVVVDGSGTPVAGQTCSVTSLRANYWGVTGYRFANYYVSFSSTGVNGQQRIQFSLDLSTAAGIPADWNWSTSAPLMGGNVTTLAGYRCDEQPILRGQTVAGWGRYTNVYMPGVENRALVGGLAACS